MSHHGKTPEGPRSTNAEELRGAKEKKAPMSVTEEEEEKEFDDEWNLPRRGSSPTPARKRLIVSGKDFRLDKDAENLRDAIAAIYGTPCDMDKFIQLVSELSAHMALAVIAAKKINALVISTKTH